MSEQSIFRREDRDIAPHICQPQAILQFESEGGCDGDDVLAHTCIESSA